MDSQKPSCFIMLNIKNHSFSSKEELEDDEVLDEELLDKEKDEDELLEDEDDMEILSVSSSFSSFADTSTKFASTAVNKKQRPPVLERM
jgi:hypothetical protein